MRSSLSPSAHSTARKPAARAASAVWRPTVNTGSAMSASRRGWRAMARAAFALVIATALNGSRGSSKSTGSTRKSGASVTWWPRARRRAAVRSPSCCGRVTSKRTPSHRCEEIGARALLELAAGLGAETHGIGGGALPLRLEHAAAVGLGDQAAKAQSPGGDDGVTRDRRAAGAFEHREEGTLGRERGRSVGVVDDGEQRERALVVAARLDGDDPLPDRRQEIVDGNHRGRAVGKPEALQAGEREHDGVDLAGGKLAQARLHIAAQGNDREVAAQPLDERLAAQRGGADARAARQLGERLGLAADEDVARVLAREHRGDHESWRQDG